MSNFILKVHPDDNVLVALRDLPLGERLQYNGREFATSEPIPQKHKFAMEALSPGDRIVMYGVTVGKAKSAIPAGARISTENTGHQAQDYQVRESNFTWQAPAIGDFDQRKFMGYHRRDGSVGTRNYWLVIPLVFCENRNLRVIREAMLGPLGYRSEQQYAVDVQSLIEGYQKGFDRQEMEEMDILRDHVQWREQRIFPNVDGIKFLDHEGGCGGIRQDSEALCRLLVGYIQNPNVAGATILSLGCQMAQVKMFMDILERADPKGNKPIVILEQQKSKSERDFISQAVKKTFLGLAEANEVQRRPAGIEHLTLGLECGGSDGFSGISANPSLGYTSDILVAAGGSAILSEFPELNGVEQELINRCTSTDIAEKFATLMQSYSARAVSDGSGFDMNPSPGNIRDGLITDAMKSAGAAKKGGTSPVVGVLDYTERKGKNGLNLLCTPGNDVESTTGLAGSGANLIAFTTGLGTPTGNPIAPTIKISSNSALAGTMRDLIDFDAGPVITGEKTIEELGKALLQKCIRIASGEEYTKAEILGQDDFIPWKRGISL